ncbi:hypothetical protein DPEC_G00145390 [Dallia pectoralis]|uniref:Uncharacterized protein n=1 Tax=Dallia pectoralis TaxID=75939 RepID=A0ACC2GNS3_DALPE|nr:hypothetical protein DPEC_G00145390 [Dallia pectoralis]
MQHFARSSRTDGAQLSISTDPTQTYQRTGHQRGRTHARTNQTTAFKRKQLERKEEDIEIPRSAARPVPINGITGHFLEDHRGKESRGDVHVLPRYYLPYGSSASDNSLHRNSFHP